MSNGGEWYSSRLEYGCHCRWRPFREFYLLLSYECKVNGFCHQTMPRTTISRLLYQGVGLRAPPVCSTSSLFFLKKKQENRKHWESHMRTPWCNRNHYCFDFSKIKIKAADGNLLIQNLRYPDPNITSSIGYVTVTPRIIVLLLLIRMPRNYSAR